MLHLIANILNKLTVNYGFLVKVITLIKFLFIVIGCSIIGIIEKKSCFRSLLIAKMSKATLQKLSLKRSRGQRVTKTWSKSADIYLVNSGTS